MREYQVQGLRWLLSQHDLGAGGILGDEMVLPHSSFFFCRSPSPLPVVLVPFRMWCVTGRPNTLRPA